MIEPDADISDVLDLLEAGKIKLWNIIESFEGGRDVHELDAMLRKRPWLTSNILFIMRELTAAVVRPI